MNSVSIFVMLLVLKSVNGEKLTSLENLPDLPVNKDLNKDNEIKILNEIYHSVAKLILETHKNLQTTHGKEVMLQATYSILHKYNQKHFKLKTNEDYNESVYELFSLLKHFIDVLEEEDNAYVRKNLIPELEKLLIKLLSILPESSEESSEEK